MTDALVRRYRAARRDRELALLEGFHALKHALRFGAELQEAVSSDPAELDRLAAELAPDLAGSLAERVTAVTPDVLAQMVPHAPRTGVVAIARRPGVDLAQTLADPRPAAMVLLEDPRTMGNMGACVRVAAAADAAGVLTTGDNDPWHPEALRGAAGLHFALPVARLDELPAGERPLVAIAFPSPAALIGTDYLWDYKLWEGRLKKVVFFALLLRWKRYGLHKRLPPLAS